MSRFFAHDLAKTAADTLRQEVTLLTTLYLIFTTLAMMDRKYVLKKTDMQCSRFKAAKGYTYNAVVSLHQ
jgi:hypothetical protein